MSTHSVVSTSSSSLLSLTARNSMAIAGVLCYAPEILKPPAFLLTTKGFNFISFASPRKTLRNSFRVAAPEEAVAGFDDMVSGTRRKYYMLGGKGGVGKTTYAASLAVKFANNRHHTLLVSTDPAHSLSDSFAQDLSGGTLVPVEGPDYPLFAFEVMQFLETQEYGMFTRIVFDTALTACLCYIGLTLDDPIKFMHFP